MKFTAVVCNGKYTVCGFARCTDCKGALPFPTEDGALGWLQQHFADGGDLEILRLALLDAGVADHLYRVGDPTLLRQLALTLALGQIRLCTAPELPPHPVHIIPRPPKLPPPPKPGPKPTPVTRTGAIRVEVTDEQNRGVQAIDILREGADRKATNASGITLYTDLDEGGAYAISVAPLSPANAEKFRVVGASVRTSERIVGGGVVNVAFKVERIIRLHIKLQFKDPDGTVRPFPKDVPVKLSFEAGAEAGERTVLTDAEGRLSFNGQPFVEVLRSAKSVNVDFTQATAGCVVCEKPGDPASQTYIAEADPNAGALKDALKTGKRMFRLPVATWTLANADWALKPGSLQTAALDQDASKINNLEPEAAVVGTPAAPAEFTLAPVWQFVRFVYYDRKLKGDDPISVPAKANGDVLPLWIEAWRDKTKEATEPASSLALWFNDAAEDKAVQCLPWILSKDGTRAADKIKPDADTLLRISRPEAHPFIHSVAAGDRKLIDLTDDALRNTPAVARLAYYDLPKLWKSRGYFGWISDTDGEFGPYEDIAAKDTTATKPIVFSFDDIVLTKADLSPVKTPWTDTTRVAVFAHSFAASPGAAKAPGDTGPQAQPTAGKPQKPTLKGRRWVNDRGVYNPAGGDGIHTSYFSQIKLNTNYIADYPNWTRLVACEGNLFDVFDQRTPDHASDVVGARAAVRWVDAVTGRPAAAVAARPGVTAQPFFAIEPLHELEHAQRFAQIQYDHAAPSTVRLGRFDLALLRCCDIDGTDEKAVNLVYFRINFAFPAPNATVQATYTGAAVPQPVPANLAGNAQLKYGEEFVTNVAARWNGTDGKPPAARAQFLPSAAPAAALKVDVVWFGQSLPGDQAQFACRIEVPEYQANPRSWFNGTEGTGELSKLGCAEEDDGSGTMWFVGAHECGHGVGLNDDYCERWSAFSYGQLSLRWHIPGDPYEPDGRTVEFGEPGAAMMNSNIEVRNRYYWHIAEWARSVTNVGFKVKIGAYDDYYLPTHATAGRTYANWPINASMTWRPDAAENRGESHLLLYALGKDKYAQTGLGTAVGSANAYDGILVVMINLALGMPQWTVAAAVETNHRRILQPFAAAVRDRLGGMNGRFYATGTVNANTPQARQFQRCLIHFSPRFVVSNAHQVHPVTGNPIYNGAKATAAGALRDNMGFQFAVHVVFDPTASAEARWMPAGAAPNAPSQADFDAGVGMAGGVLTPPDGALSTISGQLAGYDALDEVRLTERINALDNIVTACDAWLPAPPGNATAAAREQTVIDTADAAEALRDHLMAVRRDQNLRITLSDFGDVAPLVSEQFPSMFGVFKACADVTAADLEDLVKEVIPNGTVAAL
ncbi:hypothetical protein IP84_01670 [beta proteobacterium AAP99]|nr:hypothetical protein IP84_01670 [beta proteobacterium AAP99]